MFQSILLLLGRVLMSALFLWAGFSRMLNWDDTISYMNSKQMPYPDLFFAGALFLMFVGGVLLLSGFQARLGAWLLIIFTIPAVIIFHDFWNLEGQEKISEKALFMKDIAIIGGLLGYAVSGPGRFRIAYQNNDVENN